MKQKLPYYVHYAHGYWRVYRRFDGYTKEMLAFEKKEDARSECYRLNGECLKEQKQ